MEVQKCGNTPCPGIIFYNLPFTVLKKEVQCYNELCFICVKIVVLCQLMCPEGHPNEECSHCICEGQTLRGEVLSVTGVPVSGASVAVEDQPKVIRAQTDDKGLLEIHGMCSGPETRLLISKEKFGLGTVPVFRNSSENIWVRAILRSSGKHYGAL